MSLVTKIKKKSNLFNNEVQVYKRYWILNKKLRTLLGNSDVMIWVLHLGLEELQDEIKSKLIKLDCRQTAKKRTLVKKCFINSELTSNLSNDLDEIIKREFIQKMNLKLVGKKVKNKVSVSLVRYENKFLFIGQSRRQLIRLKEQVCLLFQERGLIINTKKTYLRKISQGFDFLGWTFIDYKSKLICKISSDSIASHSRDIKQLIKKVNNPERLIIELNRKIRAWENYHRCCNGIRKVWAYLNRYTHHLMLKWGRKRHSNKTKKWIYSKYWKNTIYGRTVCYVNSKKMNIILKPHSIGKKCV